MGRQIARVGDSVQYQCVLGDKFVSGVGNIISGSDNVSANGSRVARDGDQVHCGACGIGYISATGKTLVNGKKISLIGDSVSLPTGSGIIIDGSEDISSS